MFLTIFCQVYLHEVEIMVYFFDSSRVCFDFIFMLGVLYHRPDPVGTLKSLNRALNKNGEVIIDTFMIDGEDEIALTPNGRYSKIPNIYFVPIEVAFAEKENFEKQILNYVSANKRNG